MANDFRTWKVGTEEDLALRLRSFLVNVVGWYLAYIHSDTPSDRNYCFVSEGEEDDGFPVRIVGFRGGSSNSLEMDCFVYGQYGFTDGSTGSYYVGDALYFLSAPTRYRSVASKDRFCVFTYPDGGSRRVGCCGFFNSFYGVEDDPAPCWVHGQYYSYNDFFASVRTRLLRTDNVEIKGSYYVDTVCTDEGYPNPRNGKFSFFNPILYYNDGGISEVRGRLKGIYYGKPDRLAYGSFVSINDEYYLVHKTNDEDDAILCGPVNDMGTVPTSIVQLGFPSYPTLEADYSVRGMVKEDTEDGTLAFWRFDTGYLNDYIYGSGQTLPVPITYIDEAGSYSLEAQNGMVSVESRLREAADFDGASDYATTAGSATVSGALNGEWSMECVFMPGAIPTGIDVATFLHYGSDSEGNESENTLFQISLVAASGTTPDEYNVERGNIDIRWEYGTSGDVRLCTAGDFVQQGRWNYLAITKVENGSEYDVSIYHCSFGDYCAPSLKLTFTGVTNSTGGDSSYWFFGTDASLTNYYTGQIDDTRITKRALTFAEITTSCARAMI